MSKPRSFETSADVREQARQAYQDSVTAGATLNGKTLGQQFGRSERWGRERIAEIRPIPRPPLPRQTSGNGSRSEGAAAPVPVPVGARFVGWLGFLFGAAASVAANVLHAWLPAAEQPPGWTPGIAPQIGSAVWPIGLLLSVEVLSRVRWSPGLWWALARYGGAGTVAVGSAIISYGHVRELLLAWHYGPLGAAVGPLVLDGLMVVSGFALLAMSGRSGAESVTDSVIGSAAADE